MRWQLSGPWPVGSQCLPAGSIISDGEGWPMPPPLNARALDEDAAMALFMAYDEAATIGGWHQLHFHPSIDRAAVSRRRDITSGGRMGSRPRQWPSHLAKRKPRGH